MAENRRDKNRRFYFTRGQLVLLGSAAIVAGSVVFTLGMFIGKEIEARKVVRPEEPLIKVPIRTAKGAADADNDKSKDDLTFYNTLTKTPAAKAPGAKAEEKKPQSAAEAADSVEGKTAGKIWSVQVTSFPDEKSAGELIDRLKNKGYDAFITEANIKGKVWHRVRVGRFASRAEAMKTEAALKNNESYPKAFATNK
jgi:cell division protein FtsN